MVIRLFPLVVRVLTPFYWKGIVFTRERFEEGRFSISSLLPFVPPPITPSSLVTVSYHPHTTPSLPPPHFSLRSVFLNLHNCLAASVLKCGQRKIWIDPNEINKISLAESHRNVAYLHKYSIIIKKPIVVHSRDGVSLSNKAKRKGRHKGKSSAHLVLSWLIL